MPPLSPKSKLALRKQKLADATAILVALGFGPRQTNATAAYTLLAMLDLPPEKDWASAEPVLLGLKGINRFIAANYGRAYAENTRETIRDDAVKFFVEDGLLLRNPDDPARPTNSGKTAYQIEPAALKLIRKTGSADWPAELARYLETRAAIKADIARKRTLARSGNASKRSERRSFARRTKPAHQGDHRAILSGLRAGRNRALHRRHGEQIRPPRKSRVGKTRSELRGL